jgi:hypothetical protein
MAPMGHIRAIQWLPHGAISERYLSADSFLLKLREPYQAALYWLLHILIHKAMLWRLATAIVCDLIILKLTSLDVHLRNVLVKLHQVSTSFRSSNYMKNMASLSQSPLQSAMDSRFRLTSQRRQ